MQGVRKSRIAFVLGLIVAMCFAATTHGEDSNRKVVEVPLALDGVPTFHVNMTPVGLPNGGDGQPRGTCPPVIRNHTDANFGGGSFNVQAGFAQTEIAAVSFVIPAADFPIRIDTAEMIFATTGATMQTVTQWSILFWSGTPATGTVVEAFSSDDVILPHLRIGPGTAGTNVQVSVDPGDPEQIFISDSGNHTFSVGYRIDVHNNQTANPCFTSPPTNSNAFPTTDVSGLAQPAQNWLFGVNCGAFGCPPNGGWATFAALNILCRPTGDWVLRVTYTPINCAGFGACCNPTNGVCTLLTQADCGNQSGNWSGEGTTCTPNNCPQPTGACCRANGTCSANVILNACTGVGETFHQNQTCAQVSCQQPAGACCTNNNSTPCVVVDAATCAASFNGFWKGANTDCITNACNGACCFSTNSCLSLTKPGCAQIGGSQFQGVGVTCLGGNTCPKGACCLASGSCTFGTQIDCTNQGGNYQGNGITCATANCPQPSGACCLDGGGCLTLIQSECSVIPNSNWAGPGSSCPGACQAPSGACCFGGSGCLEITQADCIVIEGSNWSGAGTVCPGDCQPACPGADGDMNGDTLVNGSDVSVFTTALINGGSQGEVCHGDFNNSTALDYGDVDGMVTALLTAP